MTDPRMQDLLNTASRLREQGRVPEAIDAYRALLGAYPDLAESWYNLGWLLRQAGKGEEALSAYDEALKRGVSGPEEVRLNRAVILLDVLGRPEEAKAELGKALEIAPDYIPALVNLGNLHEDFGQKAEARAAYEKAAALAPQNGVVAARLAGLGTAASKDDPMIARLSALIAGRRLTPADQALVLFALGRLYDSCGAYEEAAQSFARANEAARVGAAGAIAPYNPQGELRRADLMAAAFAPVRGRASGIAAPSPRPVFILGMFRSGSTLLEQMLAAHSQVTSGGEMDIVPRIARGLGKDPAALAGAPDSQILEYAEAYLTRLRTRHPGAGIVTDKRPDNFWYVGLIKRLFPDAKIVHTERHPLDNLISVWGLYLDVAANYSFRPQDIAGHIHAERQMMHHWKQLYPGDILTVRYEDVVRAPEAEIRRALDFLGLPFEEACLDFHSAPSMVRTASVWQVRQPLHDRSIGRWRHYETYLRSVADGGALSGLIEIESSAKPA